MEKIGLIAGNRNFPLKFCEGAKKKDCFIVAIAVKGDTSPKINKLADKVYWLGLKEYSRMFEIFKSEGIKEAVMAGQISPRRLFSKELAQDPQLREIFLQIKDRRADTIFSAIAEKLKDAGVKLLDSTLFMEDFIPKKGTLTSSEPDFGTWEDIYFGFDMAKGIACLDIGQTVAVKNQAVVAVEALEGTDNLIRRAGRIAKDGICLIKVSKPKQDLRFDIPVVGLRTIKNLARIKAKALAFEAKKTIFLDREACLRLAKKKNISIVAI